MKSRYAVLVASLLLAACTKSATLDEGFRGDDAANGSLYFSVSPASGLVTNENGGTATFTVVMLRQPKSDVSVPILSNNTGEGQVYQQGGNCLGSGQPSASTCNITFTPSNWNLPQTVKVGGVDDAVQDQTIAYKVILSATSSSDPNFAKIDPPDVSLTNLDNDTPGISIVPAIAGSTHTSESGGFVIYNVYLNSQPTATTTLTLTSSATAVGQISRTGGGSCDAASAASALACTLTFNTGSCVQSAGSWCFAQQIKITGQNDTPAVVNSSGTAYSINLSAASADTSYNGMAASASLVNDDNDTAAITTSISSGLATSEAATAGTFTVQLATQPTANVTLQLSSSATGEAQIRRTTGTCNNAGATSAAACTITFTTANWNTPQTIGVTGINDSLLDGAQAFQIDISVSATTDGNYSGLTATVTGSNADNEVGNRIFVTNAVTLPNFSSFAAADAFCAADANKPSTGIYKAIISKSTATVRRACTNPNCSPSGGQANWVLAASTNYYRASDGVFIGTTNASAIFTFPLSNSFSSSAVVYLTGLNNDWTSGQDCNSWLGDSGFCQIGDGSFTTNQAIANGSIGFLLSRAVLCVEQ